VQDFFGWHIPDELILRERASAKPTYGRIEPTASGIVRGDDFGGCFHTSAMHVDADFTFRAITDNRT
jgi:hypothetical protein